MVRGRPTYEAGLKPLEGGWSLVGRSYGEYRNVLETLKRIRDYNPDAALAVWNVLRLANPGHEVEVYFHKLGKDGQPVADEQGKAIIEELAARVGQEYGGGLDTLIDVFNLTLMTQGAFAAEVELSDDMREVVDYCAVDPRFIDFVRDEETHKMVPVILAAGEPKRINPNQFRYIPLDPDVDAPHGRSPLWSALEVVFFQQEVLRDLKAVVHNQGYPRIDVSVLEEIVVENTPEHLKAPGREEEFRAWIDGFLMDLQETYNSLQPDDTFIHWDWVKVGYVGPGAAGSLDAQRVLQAIDTQIVAALKQLPVLLGRNEGATTTHATVQWQIYVAGIEALQRRTKRMVEWLHNTALQVYGRPSYARVNFHPIRKVDREAEARAAKMETDTLIAQVQAGWISNDEAAQKAVGHSAVGVMTILPQGMRSMETTCQICEATGSRQVAPLAPPESGVPEWLWERTRRVDSVYRRWAENSFLQKMQGYLTAPVRMGGDGDGTEE
jgi:hypothetical protein